MNPPHQFLQLSLSCPCSPDPAPSSVPPVWPIPSSLLQQTHEVSEDSPHRHLGFFLLLRRKLLQGQGWEHFGPLGWTQQLMRYLKGNDRLQVQVCHIQKGWKKNMVYSEYLAEVWCQPRMVYALGCVQAWLVKLAVGTQQHWEADQLLHPPQVWAHTSLELLWHQWLRPRSRKQEAAHAAVKFLTHTQVHLMYQWHKDQ